jgi:hypothetical protein
LNFDKLAIREKKNMKKCFAVILAPTCSVWANHDGGIFNNFELLHRRESLQFNHLNIGFADSGRRGNHIKIRSEEGGRERE